MEATYLQWMCEKLWRKKNMGNSSVFVFTTSDRFHLFKMDKINYIAQLELHSMCIVNIFKMQRMIKKNYFYISICIKRCGCQKFKCKTYLSISKVIQNWHFIMFYWYKLIMFQSYLYNLFASMEFWGHQFDHWINMFICHSRFTV